MRCRKCKKNFDEEMYSGICPKCGYFNNRKTEYDVSRYISSRFDDSGKTSTSAQAAKQHEQLHRVYDSRNMHSQTQRPLSGNRQAPVYGQGISLGKPNPYQKTHDQRKNERQAKLNGEIKERNFVTPICILISALAIAVTVIACQMKKESLADIYYTPEFEKETAQPGELFELNERLFAAEKANVIDTSALEGMPEGEKLVAVTLEIMPADKNGSSDISYDVYASDGFSHKESLEDYTVVDLLYYGDYSKYEYILSGHYFKNYSFKEGKRGECYFFVDENAEEITISFEVGGKKSGLYVLQKRVSIPLKLEEDGI